MAKFSLYLLGEDQLTLAETAFEHPLCGRKLCTRGNTEGAFEGYGSFRWTSGVQALAILLIQCAACKEQRVLPFMSGEQKSLAASLDYCLSKVPLCLLNMFGSEGLALGSSPTSDKFCLSSASLF